MSLATPESIQWANQVSREIMQKFEYYFSQYGWQAKDPLMVDVFLRKFFEWGFMDGMETVIAEVEQRKD